MFSVSCAGLAKKMQEQGVSKHKLAKDIHVCRTTITRWLRGQEGMSAFMALVLAQYFQCKVEDLIELAVK